MNKYIFIAIGFAILLGAFIPIMFFLRNVKHEKAQIIIDNVVVFQIVFITLCAIIGMLIYYLLSESYSALPLFLSSSLAACVEGIISRQTFGLSEQFLCVGIKKYNIEQLHVLSIEKRRKHMVTIKAEITSLKSQSKEIILWLSESNYQKCGAIFQEKQHSEIM